MKKAEEKELKQTFLADMLARLIPAYDDNGYTWGKGNDYRENIILPFILNNNEWRWLKEAANGNF
jgi:hypothetical protein